MNGFDKDLRSALVGVNSHVTIGVYALDSDHKLQFDDEIIEKIGGSVEYESATPFTLNQGLINSSLSQKGVLIKGIEPDHEINNTELISLFKSDLETVEPTSPEKAMEIIRDLAVKTVTIPSYQNEEKKEPKILNLPGIILGASLAKNLGADIDSVVELVSLRERITPLGGLPRIKKFQVRGIFRSGMSGYDELMAFVDMKYSQKFFGMGNKITGISINLSSPDLAQSAGESLSKDFQFPQYVRTWIDENANLFLVIQLEKLGLSVILSLIILIAAANIIGSLIMLVIEKKRDITILKAMGVKDSSIKKIFVYQGAIIGLSGTLIGEILGVALSLAIKHFKIIEIPEGVYVGNKIPLYINEWHLVIIGVISLLICLVVTVYPSTKAAKISSVDGLRND